MNFKKLIITFSGLMLTAQSSIAVPYRQETAMLYNQCEKQREILDKTVCMHILRGYLEGEYVYFIADWTDLKSREFSQYSEEALRKIHRQERQLVQIYISMLPAK
ncbi:hypothetical protein NIES4102_25170 [Chondrocystis sp. NIES-4102]|nr:hypothetical protein NIES4102_25170 [Chondrocystis sp. NIES-4102]